MPPPDSADFRCYAKSPQGSVLARANIRIPLGSAARGRALHANRASRTALCCTCASPNHEILVMKHSVDSQEARLSAVSSETHRLVQSYCCLVPGVDTESHAEDIPLRCSVSQG